MRSLRPGLLRPLSLVILGLAMTACSSAGSSAAPATNAPQVSSAASSAPLPAATGTTAASLAPSVAAGGGTGDCSASLTGGHVKYTLDGFEAWHFCGPATATVTLGSTTVQITSGWCETNAAGYSVAIGTQLFGSPSPTQEPDMLNILADPTTGSGSIGGVVAHKHWLLIGQSVTFGAGKTSGTFAGSDVSGAAVHGSFTC
ncbi:MAG TPA: hypothetical protein VF371_12300 [Candidatus Limnocylindrales bacterium]|jgi:hypothetical protein